ncbi:MAG: hypothetical protein WC516_07840 [Patescibacteria group bacterium]
MKNDTRCHLRLNSGIFIPEEINEYVYKGIRLFSSIYDDQYRITEYKTGYQIGKLADDESVAIDSAKEIIDAMGVANVKKAIKLVVNKTKEGMVYDVEGKKWVSMYGEGK